MRVVTVANQKGGVAKTTTALALAAGFSRMGKKVLLLDMDPQGNSSSGAGADKDGVYGMYHLLKNVEFCTASDALQENTRSGYDIIASNNLLASADQEMTMDYRRQFRLKDRLNGLENGYDYVIIDTGPALGNLLFNALCISTDILIPTDASEDALDALINLYTGSIEVARMYNTNISSINILRVRYKPSHNTTKAFDKIVEELPQKCPDITLCDTVIRENNAVEKARMSGKDIYAYDKNSNCSKDYQKLIDELMKKWRAKK